MEGAEKAVEHRRAKLERRELVKDPLRENDRVAKRILGCPVVKCNFNPSRQEASLPSTILLKLILEIFLRRHFGKYKRRRLYKLLCHVLEPRFCETLQRRFPFSRYLFIAGCPIARFRRRHLRYRFAEIVKN